MHSSFLNIGRRSGNQSSNAAQVLASHANPSPLLAPSASAPHSKKTPSNPSTPKVLSRASSPKPSPRNTTPHHHNYPVKMSFRLESGPLVMYGPIDQSTGALLSGVLDIEATQSVVLKEASLSIIQEISYKAAVLPAIAAMGRKQKNKEVLAKWNVLEHHQEFATGVHSYPFSHLMPGSLPPSSDTSLFKIEYYLEAEVFTDSMGSIPLRLHYHLPVGRSIVSLGEKTSVRIFPPTDLTVTMELPLAVFPRGYLPAELRIENISIEDESGKFTRWRPRRMNYHLDETIKIKAPIKEDGSNDTAEPIVHKVQLREGQAKQGWKVDFSHKGLVQFVTSDLAPGSFESANRDVADPVSGISVEHILHVEIVVAEEVAPGRSAQGVLTGNARVLRMQFKVPVMDRPGLGISWDDEVPPVYADVPLSPPTYDGQRGPSLEEVTNMMFSPTFSPAVSAVPSPTLRHIDPTVHGPEPSAHLFSSLNPLNRVKQQLRSSLSGSDLRPSQSAPQPGRHGKS